jgi:hypothetical protein
LNLEPWGQNRAGTGFRRFDDESDAYLPLMSGCPLFAFSKAILASDDDLCALVVRKGTT